MHVSDEHAIACRLAVLPKNPQDKVLKYQLREEGQTAQTWDLEKSGLKVPKR